MILIPRLSVCLLAAATVTMAAPGASALIIDADGFDDGTDISNSFAGVTLSTNGNSVIALDSSSASTGTSVFGRSGLLFNSSQFTLDPEVGLRTAAQIPLTATFDEATGAVSIDVIGQSGRGPTGTLAAFDGSGNELGRATSAALAAGEVETISVSDPDGQIFSVSFGSTDAFGLTADNLRTGVDAIPEPASLALLSLGGLAVLRRRSA